MEKGKPEGGAGVGKRGKGKYIRGGGDVLVKEKEQRREQDLKVFCLLHEILFFEISNIL